MKKVFYPPGLLCPLPPARGRVGVGGGAQNSKRSLINLTDRRNAAPMRLDGSLAFLVNSHEEFEE